MFNVKDIQNADLPYSNGWFVSGELKQIVDLSKMGFWQRGKFIEEHNIRRRDIQEGAVSLKTKGRYVHSGDEFVQIETDSGQVSIRWGHVVDYRLRETPND